MKFSKFTGSLAIAVMALVLGVAANVAQGQVIYDSTVTPLPGNLPSVGPEAYAFNELGDAVTFGGTARNLRAVTVTMSSWGCQAGAWFSADCVTTPGATFSIPITLNIYNAGSPTPGSLIASKTQTFAIPYRPSSDASCTGGRWKEATSGTCFNGLANNITFDLFSLNVVLPNSAVYGIVYNTTSFGPVPIGPSAPCFTGLGGCPYDSLNIALSSAVVTGSKPFPNTLYWNDFYASNYCDGGLDGTGTFRLDSRTSACWFDSDPLSSTFGQRQIPAAKFYAFTIATRKDDCKNGGWQTHTTASGKPFKNQGQCIDYVNDKKDNDDTKDNDDKKDHKKDKKDDKHDH